MSGEPAPLPLTYEHVASTLALPKGYGVEDLAALRQKLKEDEPSGNFSRRTIFLLFRYCLAASRQLSEHAPSRPQ